MALLAYPEHEFDPDAAARARVGEIVADRWLLEAVVGVGGTAAVFRARHRNGSPVAIKVMHQVHLANRKACERFLRESLLANRIDHPSVPRVFDEGRLSDGAPYLVTELLVGQSLEEERLCSGGRLPLQDVFDVGFAVLDMLACAHRAGLVHRDLKPDNLFRTASGEIKVLDFGLGRLMEPSMRAKRFTSTCMAMGTVGFMAPEQALGKHDSVGPVTDVWAMGATLLMLATGLETHPAETPMEALGLVVTRPVERTRARAALMPALCDVIDRALMFRPCDRFQSVEEMRRALANAHDSLGAGANTRRDLVSPLAIPFLPVPDALDEPSATSDAVDLSGERRVMPRTPPLHLTWDALPKTRTAIAALVCASIAVGFLLANALS